VALYRVIVLSNDPYSNNPDDPYWIAAAAAAVHETCHTNQYWSLRFLWMSKWDKETECTLKHIDALKQIGAPQYFMDAS
jgi:hypothetical protein